MAVRSAVRLAWELARFILVFLGGGAGSALRYGVSLAVYKHYPGRLPLGTFVINVTGSFLAGALMTVLTRRASHPNWRLLLVTGFLGGYTTFSSFEYETLIAAQGGNALVALGNVLASVSLGFVAVWLGSALAAR